uniref:Neur_chan_LBD domain-containing protein n=1 Tax=Steinernema glaseri TaxID=37863 RepID=A0A1I8APV0_9BILA
MEISNTITPLLRYQYDVFNCAKLCVRPFVAFSADHTKSRLLHAIKADRPRIISHFTMKLFVLLLLLLTACRAVPVQKQKAMARSYQDDLKKIIIERLVAFSEPKVDMPIVEIKEYR